MDVLELIEILKTYPPKTLVVGEGYENGYSPIKKVQLISVEENKNKEWWDGKYLESENNNTATQVVFLDAETKAGSLKIK